MQVKPVPHFRVGNAIRFPASVIKTHYLEILKMKMKFSIMPSRAVSDLDQAQRVRTLSSNSCFTSANQICYPNQSTLGDLIGVSRAPVIGISVSLEIMDISSI